MPGIQLQAGTPTGNGLKENEDLQVGDTETWTVTSTYGTSPAATISRSNTNVTLSTTSVSTNSGTFTITAATAGSYIVDITQTIPGSGKVSTQYYRGRISGTVSSAGGGGGGGGSGGGGGGGGATPSYSLGTVSTMNEGASQTVSVSTSNVSNGTTLYWNISGSGDFTAHSGSFTISSNAGSFTISSIGDQTTEGTETKTLSLHTGSASGTQVDSTTFSLLDTSTASGGGSGGGGAGTGGSSTGTASYGLAVYDPNGNTVVFGTNLRTQNIVFTTTQSAVSGTTYGPFTVANANDTSKVQILAEYNNPTGSSQTVSGSDIVLTKTSTGFSFKHTAGGTKTFVLTAIQIA